MERTAAKFIALEHRIETLRPAAAEAPHSPATPDPSAPKPEEPAGGPTTPPAESPSPS
jgi:hypothetical protein